MHFVRLTTITGCEVSEVVCRYFLPVQLPYTVNLVLVRTAKNNSFPLFLIVVTTLKNYFLGKCHCTN